MEISLAIAGSSSVLLIVLISTVHRQRKYSDQVAGFTLPELPKKREMPFGGLKFKRAI
jgi:hypothetical protein